MAKKLTPRERRIRRHLRMRKKIKGTPERPRFNVFRSHKHIYAQIINDAQGFTLVSASTLDPELRGRLDGLKKTGQAALVGEIIAKRALSKGILEVVFDRGGYKYHGRVKALAEGVRKGGLKF